MALRRSTRSVIRSKMRRCASRKKAFDVTMAIAVLNASLSIRIAPSTDRSASRLCGSVRSGAATAVSAIDGAGSGSGIGIIGTEEQLYARRSMRGARLDAARKEKGRVQILHPACSVTDVCGLSRWPP